MNAERMIYRPHRGDVSFGWSGGSYIDIYSLSDDSEPLTREDFSRYAPQGAPFANVHVWNYDTDTPTITGREEFERECEEWIRECGPDYGLA